MPAGFRWPALACLAVLVASMLSGCLSAGDAADEDAAAPWRQDVPPGCDRARAAVAHGPDGAPATWTHATGIPCFIATEWGAWEPSIGLTGDGTLFLYPALTEPLGIDDEVAGMVTGVGVARSRDEGAHFDRLHSELAGVVNWHPATVDPYMYVDPYTDRIFLDDLLIPPFNCGLSSFSDDGGESWTQSVSGCMVFDHVGYASGPPAVSDPTFPVVIQRCAITLGATILASFGTGCQKSLDGGLTWQPPGQPPFLFDQDGQPYVPSTCHGGAHHPFIDHRGWTWIGRTWCDGRPYVALSKDEGATWTQHLIHDAVADAWHDVAVGVDAAGNVITFWIGAESRPLASVSTDDGQTWSGPWDIGPPGLFTAGMSSLAPGGVGKAAFTYVAQFDDRDDNHAVAVAAYGLDTASPVFLSATLTTPEAPLWTGGTCSGGTCSGQNDFLDASIGPDGSVWGSFKQDAKVSAGRLWGAPSLWDAEDPNGPYGA